MLLLIDFPSAKKKQDKKLKKQNEAFADKHEIEGFPTTLFLTADGKELGRFDEGYEGGGPKPWIKRAQPIVSKGKTKPQPAGDEKKKGK